MNNLLTPVRPSPPSASRISDTVEPSCRVPLARGLLSAVLALAGHARDLEAVEGSDLGSATHPVIVHKLQPAFVITDGTSDHWATITAVPAPFSHRSAGMLKLGWTDAGLFGYLEVADVAISVDAFSPWAKDALELWLETDAARSYDMSDHAYQIALAPNPEAGAGRAIVIPASGAIPADTIDARWKPIPGGYALEFFVPAAQLKVSFHDGLTVGMNYAVDEKGVAIEEFYHDKDMDSGFCSPCTWGMITLKP